MTLNDTYTQLIELLNQHKAYYRLIDHPPEGRTEIVSPMRGNKVSQAAKCIVHGTYISFATPEIAERLAGSIEKRRNLLQCSSFGSFNGLENK